MRNLHILLVTISCVRFITGDTCICAKTETFLYRQMNKSSTKHGRLHKDKCLDVQGLKYSDQWIGVFSKLQFGYVAVDDVTVEKCLEPKNKNSANRSKRFLFSCEDHGQCSTCICEHFLDFDYANKHKDCYRCSGCHVDCGKYFQEKNRQEHTTKQQSHTSKHHTSAAHHHHVTMKPQTTATTTRSSSTTNHMTSSDEHTCDKLDIISLLAEERLSNYSSCTEGSDTHLFVMDNCKTNTRKNNWIQRRKIVDNCDKIAPYTAVGSTTYGIYGSFIGCNQENGHTEIKIATQFCGRPAEILHIPGTSNTRRFGPANSYYTIAW